MTFVQRTGFNLLKGATGQAAPNSSCCHSPDAISVVLNRTAPKGASSDRNRIDLFSRRNCLTPGGRLFRVRERASDAVAKAAPVLSRIRRMPSDVGRRPFAARQGVRTAFGALMRN